MKMVSVAISGNKSTPCGAETRLIPESEDDKKLLLLLAKLGPGNFQLGINGPGEYPALFFSRKD